MKIASVADVKAHFSAYLRASEQGPVVVTRNGKPAAVLLAVSDEDCLERLMLAHSPRLQEILTAAQGRIDAGAGISDEEFWKDVEGVEKTKKRGTASEQDPPSQAGVDSGARGADHQEVFNKPRGYGAPGPDDGKHFAAAR